jgi:hypothetical protein
MVYQPQEIEPSMTVLLSDPRSAATHILHWADVGTVNKKRACRETGGGAIGY